MKRKPFLVIAAAVAAVVFLTVCMVLYKGDRSTKDIVGTWMIYEGGNVAPDVLTFNADGTGVAYVLSDAYQDNSMTDVQIPKQFLDRTDAFQWRIEKEMLIFSYASGERDSYVMSFYTMADVRMLSLKDRVFGGGWIPAKIID